MFANMYATYDALSQPMQAFLSGLQAWHGSEHVLGGTLGQKRHDGQAEYPRALHPVVRTHPETNRKCLYVNSGFTTRIEGLGEKESRAVLDMLFDHVRTPEFQCRFRWQRNPWRSGTTAQRSTTRFGTTSRTRGSATA